MYVSVSFCVSYESSTSEFNSFPLTSRSNLLTTNYSLGQMLARHYISGALFRAGWVVGSLDLIGSPAGFTRTVGDGLKDFVAMPYQGIMQVRISFEPRSMESFTPSVTLNAAFSEQKHHFSLFQYISIS